MTKDELSGIWNYYLSLERDLANTSRYIEPVGQECVHSFEFTKLIILACTEVESVFKWLCAEIDGTRGCGNIADYKQVILGKYPRIVDASVTISRLGRSITPFEKWDSEKLSWWDAYTQVKHNRGKNFGDASYINAVLSLSGLYILIFYLAKTANLEFSDYKADYIDSQYAHPAIFCAPNKQLPDFEEVHNETSI
ncbi:MAG: hypothetical protein VB021_04695 [Oscillospiraceae bacterium]|nr:hypothetical protein [Oscillospiraceae bacterium]